jgi:hypothetical protein
MRTNGDEEVPLNRGEYKVILSKDEKEELLHLLRSNILFVPTKPLAQRVVGGIGAVNGVVSFSFSIVLGFDFGTQVVKFLNINNSAGRWIIGGLFSASAFIPLAMLSAPHSKDTFEALYEKLSCMNSNIIKSQSNNLTAN